MDKITLNHGSGCLAMQRLIREVFISAFGNDMIVEQPDAAVFNIRGAQMAFTTDSFVVNPLFFPGGDIGKLAVCGTVNDLTVSGANPLYLSAGFIIEEGFEIDLLKRIVLSMAAEARHAGVKIVTGDTKVVEKGCCDKLFINTSGVGFVPEQRLHLWKGSNIAPGDQVIVNGTLGDHGIGIMTERNKLPVQHPVKSDCASLNHLISAVMPLAANISFMRDLTRGGLAAGLNEVAEKKTVGIDIDEQHIPVRPEVEGLCELLGFDPVFVANEGKCMFIVKPAFSEQILRILRSQLLGKESKIIGQVTDKHPGMIHIKTTIGGTRILRLPEGDQLPRIC